MRCGGGEEQRASPRSTAPHPAEAPRALSLCPPTQRVLTALFPGTSKDFGGSGPLPTVVPFLVASQSEPRAVQRGGCAREKRNGVQPPGGTFSIDYPAQHHYEVRPAECSTPGVSETHTHTQPWRAPGALGQGRERGRQFHLQIMTVHQAEISQTGQDQTGPESGPSETGPDERRPFRQGEKRCSFCILSPGTAGSSCNRAKLKAK